ncbi:MAG: Gldg family protein [Chloroflexi bacterium]|nr:Gldg family protein [Chloroflexota bacterium]
MEQPTNTDETILSALAVQARTASFWSMVAGIAGVIAAVAGGIMFLAIDELNNFSLSVLIVGAALIFLALVLSPRGVAIFLVGRQARFGTNVLIMTVAFFAIAILVNFLFFRSATRFDVTVTRFFSLAPQTAQILEELDSPIRANAFFVEGDSRYEQAELQAEDILNEFSRHSDKFEYRFEDPQLNRTLALRYGVTQFPTIVIENLDTGAIQPIYPATEQQIVTGMLIVTGIERKKVYILTGHSERSSTRNANTGAIETEGLDLALEGLLRDNYAVQALNLLQIREVPSDAAAVVVAGPSQELDVNEAAALDRYLSRGGRMVFLLDPGGPRSFALMLAEWGVRIGEESIADAGSSVAGQPMTPLIQRANGQFIRGEISGAEITTEIEVSFFPGVTYVSSLLSIEDMPPQITFVPLAQTTAASWEETDPGNPRPNPGVEAAGPFPIAGVVEACAKVTQPATFCSAGTPTTKIVIFGDSDFTKNQFFTSQNNADLFLNSINYLTDDFELISIRPKVFPVRQLILTSNERGFIQWSSYILPPALMLLAGAFVWWRRR